MNTDSDVLQKAFNTSRVIWIAILAALAIYIIVGHALAGREFIDSSTIPLPLIRVVLAAVGGAMLVGSFFIRRGMLEPQASGAPGDAAGTAARYRSATMITAGICEAVGLFGLVLIFLGDGLPTLYLFNIVAAAALVLHRPKLEELEQLAGRPACS